MERRKREGNRREKTKKVRKRKYIDVNRKGREGGKRLNTEGREKRKKERRNKQKTRR